MPWLLFLFLIHAAHAQSLADKVDALVAESTLLQQSHWGAKLVHSTSGRVLYSRNETSHFVPASNTKLFSTALALSRLGSRHRLATRVVALRPLQDGVLAGDLRLVGGGDPTLSGRPLPYQYKAPYGPALGALEELVEQLWQAGLRRVTGDIVGDDSAYYYEPYPEGWSVDDTLFDYGAPVSALILHDNAFRVRIEGTGTPGLPARLSLDPPNAYLSLHNMIRTVTAPPHRISMDRTPGSRSVELWGSIRPSAVRALDAAVDDPARYAAFALREALQRRGIQVDGGFQARHRFLSQSSWTANSNGEVELARRASPPLSQLVQVTNKVSQNLWAEICLREVARVRGAEPSRKGGLEQLDQFLSEIGVGKKEYRFEDGSGLSRLTLVTPAAIARLLRYMDKSAEQQAWVESLPVGGEDGSLALRFKEKNAPAGVVRAKTGTISHVTALSGYLDTERGDRLIFSVIVNNANDSATAIRRWVDKLVLLFLSAGV
jgi:D-alanyl-D-alanine carboxypeptidase/D-alanyl-D-alanine-endopeptidase (penicillin-binding protein 4)